MINFRPVDESGVVRTYGRNSSVVTVAVEAEGAQEYGGRQVTHTDLGVNITIR